MLRNATRWSQHASSGHDGFGRGRLPRVLSFKLKLSALSATVSTRSWEYNMASVESEFRLMLVKKQLEHVENPDDLRLLACRLIDLVERHKSALEAVRRLPASFQSLE